MAFVGWRRSGSLWVREDETLGPSALSVSANGRYFVNASGTPVFMRTFSLWPGAVSNPARRASLLASIKARKFNTLKVYTIGKWGQASGSNQANAYGGITPFTGANFTTPRASYFDRIDEFWTAATSEGFYFWNALLYFGYRPAGSGQGWKPEADAAGVSAVQSYAAYIGARHATRGNMLWLLAGDHTPDHTGTTEDNPKILKAVLDGLRGAGANQPAFPHFGGEDTDAIIVPDGHTWDARCIYTWTKAGVSTFAVDRYHAGGTPKPLIATELYYERNGGTDNGKELRAQWWRALLGGCIGGVDYGNEAWGYPDSGGSEPFAQGGDWPSYTSDSGAAWYEIMADVVTAETSWWLLVPETNGGSTIVTSGGGTIGTTGYVSRARASDGRVGFYYIYGGGSFTVDLSGFAGAVEAHWVNTTTGATTSAGTFSNSGTQSFTAPSSADWCLRIRRT